MVGTLIIATIAMVLAVPLGVAMALFVNEYAPAHIHAFLTSAIDLLAALPSLLFGLWGLKVLQAHLAPVSHFIASHLSVIPFLRLRDGDPIVGSSFIAGVVARADDHADHHVGNTRHHGPGPA